MMLEAIQIILSLCTAYCFYRDGRRKDDKSICFGALGLLVVSAIELFKVVTEVS